MPEFRTSSSIRWGFVFTSSQMCLWHLFLAVILHFPKCQMRILAGRSKRGVTLTLIHNIHLGTLLLWTQEFPGKPSFGGSILYELHRNLFLEVVFYCFNKQTVQMRILDDVRKFWFWQLPTIDTWSHPFWHPERWSSIVSIFITSKYKKIRRSKRCEFYSCSQ